MPAAARRKQRAQRLKLLGQFVREHSWGVMITVLIVIALVLFVCVIAHKLPEQFQPMRPLLSARRSRHSLFPA